MSFEVGDIGDMTTAGQTLTGSAPVRKLSMWHAMIVDWRLTNPADAWSVCAKFFNVSAPWVSSIINSDLFKTYYAERLGNHQEFLSKEIIAKASRTASAGLDAMHDKFMDDADELSLTEISDATDMAMRSLGFGVKVGTGGGGGGEININFGTLSQDALSNAQNKMRQVAHLNTVENGEVPEDGDTLHLDEEVGLEIADTAVAPPLFDETVLPEARVRKPKLEPIELPKEAAAVKNETEYLEEELDEGDTDFFKSILANTD
ncbi:MAG: hypothetical protein L3J79_01380 [Candidatus Marinimicrobia bacterium]|nr:hypothetical protein [Candidatus Neomarinimicrobiota bacterium]